MPQSFKEEKMPANKEVVGTDDLSSLAIIVPLRSGYLAALRAFEKQYFTILFSEANGNITFAGRAAGLDRNTCRRHAIACGVLGNNQEGKS